MAEINDEQLRTLINSVARMPFVYTMAAIMKDLELIKLFEKEPTAEDFSNFELQVRMPTKILLRLCKVVDKSVTEIKEQIKEKSPVFYDVIEDQTNEYVLSALLGQIIGMGVVSLVEHRDKYAKSMSESFAEDLKKIWS